MYYPYKVIVSLYKDSKITVLQDYGRTFDEGNYLQTAKRLVREYLGSEPGYLKGLDNIDRMDIKKVPGDIRNNWPSGVLTIPVYCFEYSV